MMSSFRISPQGIAWSTPSETSSMATARETVAGETPVAWKMFAARIFT